MPRVARSAVAALVAGIVIAGCAASGQSSTATSADSGITTASTSTPSSSTTSSSCGEGVGSYDHTCDGQFCSTHQCIGDFQGEPGYIVECADGAYSHAGGIQGACSHHGGEVSAQALATGSSPTPSPPSTGGPGYGVQDLPVQCGSGVAGSSGVSCLFAENAFYEYWQASGGSPTQSANINVWSAEGQQYFPLSCASGDGVVDCTGTNSSGVALDARFSQQAVSAYTSSEAAAYAASGKLGPNG